MPPANPPSIRRRESQFRGAGGDPMFRRSWSADRPARRCVVLVHGFAEHSGRYDHVGAWLAERGSEVHAYDQRGHGRSAPSLGRIGDFAGLLDDLDAFLEHVAQEHPDLPVWLVGHSMGGLVVAALLSERAPSVAGAALSGPALEISPDVSAAKRRASGLIGRLMPRLRIRAGLDPRGLSRDPEVVRRYVEDPLVFEHVEAGFASGMFSAIERTAARAGSVRCPVLLLHGEEDPLCLPSGSERFHAGLPTPGSELRLYPSLRHEILNEPEREQVLRDLLEWIEARESERGDGL